MDITNTKIELIKEWGGRGLVGRIERSFEEFIL